MGSTVLMGRMVLMHYLSHHSKLSLRSADQELLRQRLAVRKLKVLRLP